MRSPLRKVVVGLYYSPFCFSGRGEIAVLRHLTPFSASLRVLELQYAPSGSLSFESNGMQFAHVHTLTVRYKTRKIIGLRLDDLFIAFPNLRVLQLPIDEGRADIGDPDADLDEEFNDEKLEVERASQLSRRRGRWPSLDRLICPVRWGYSSALPKVESWERVHLDLQQDALNRNKEIIQFRTLWGDLRPSHLDLMLDAIAAHTLNLLLKMDGITHLNVVLLRLDMLYEQGDYNWLRNFLDATLTAISETFLGLSLLSIRLCDNELFRSKKSDAIDASVEALDTWALVAPLAKSLPHLRHVVIRSRRGQQQDVCWRITRGEVSKDVQVGGSGGVVAGSKLSANEMLRVLEETKFSSEVWSGL
ncbi:hypothetical protein BXZ70DRAFT_948523 [Cristinia sonorae]|uniref:Uncharacterized protein n=1 Tax=Cristinia sonorae TaxID=1940300 RepID=A0A8K0UKD0_9AGAR|nr:hypothetical protein BXZ70DRAFT_948523 [Cristinia sonorae]